MLPLLALVVLLQDTTDAHPEFALFTQRDSLAVVLLRYDACAWRTSDVLLAQDSASMPRLGPEWLCYARAGAWNAVYGRFDPQRDRYDVVLHYVMHDTVITHSTEPLDTAAVTAEARALHQAMDLLPPELNHTGFTLNKYVLPMRAGFDVWFLPAWQPSGEAVFGGEAQYSFDSTGRTVLTRRVIPGPLRWYRPDTSVAFRIDSNSPDVPTVGDFFFYYLVRRWFKEVRIQTPKYSSSRIPTDSGEVWVHVIRQ